MASGARQDIVIIGGGIIGISAAYYLLVNQHFAPGSTVTLVENVAIASAASGKAGGFISRDWHNSATLNLANSSWLEHCELAQRFNGAQKWGWRKCGAIGLRVGELDGMERSAYRILPEGEGMQGESWLNGEREDMSGTGGIAQLDPAQYCRVMHEECTRLGLVTHLAEPLQSASSSSKSITLRSLSTNSIFSLPYSSLVIAAGPWSNKVCNTLALPSIALSNLPGHSILLRPSLSAVKIDPSSQLPSAAVFAGISTTAIGVHASTSGVARSLTASERDQGYTASPELFPRANGLVFVAGENSIPSVKVGKAERFAGEMELPNRLPRDAAGVDELLDKALIARLLSSAAQISPALSLAHGAVLEKEQFCYRPVHADGSPMIGTLKDNVFLATAHGPWGITLAPGTGKVIAELVLGRPLSCDISQLAPFRSPIKSML